MNTSDSNASAKLADIVNSGGPDRRLKVRIIVAVAAILLGLALWLWLGGRGQSGPALPPYATMPLGKGHISLIVTATGNLEPTNSVTVGSELSGTTLEVYVDTNDRVKKGQPLAKLDTSKLAQQAESSRASLKSARASVAQAEANLREAEATLARQTELRRLSDNKIPSQADFDSTVAAADRARANLQSAQASVSVSEAQVRINENDLAKAILKSPIDGIVLTRSLEPGQTVAASFQAPELFVIAENLEQMKLKVAIAEADIGRLNAGQKASFKVDAWPNRIYSANVVKVSYGSSVTNNVVTYQTELVVRNDDLSLRPGMTATADISVAEASQVFTVPNAALRFDPSSASDSAPAAQKTFVQSIMPGPPRFQTARPKGQDTGSKVTSTARIWVLRDGQPVALEVKTGLNDGRQTEISGEGLREGLEIILRANRNATP